MTTILFVVLGLSLALNISFISTLKKLKKEYMFIEVNSNERNSITN